MTHLGNMLRLYRVSRGNRGIREVAEAMGLSPSTLQRIEAGKDFDVATLLKLYAWMLREPGEEG